MAACGIGAPHTTTLARVFERLGSDGFGLLSANWAQSLNQPASIALCGKEMRGAKNGNGSRVYLLSAIDQDTQPVLAQVVVREKSNEISQVPVFMDHFSSLTDVIVTADALRTQTSHANYLVELGAHYIFTVKGNQPSLLKQLSSNPWEQVPDVDRISDTDNVRHIGTHACLPKHRWPPAAHLRLRKAAGRHYFVKGADREAWREYKELRIGTNHLRAALKEAERDSDDA